MLLVPMPMDSVTREHGDVRGYLPIMRVRGRMKGTPSPFFQLLVLQPLEWHSISFLEF